MQSLHRDSSEVISATKPNGDSLPSSYVSGQILGHVFAVRLLAVSSLMGVSLGLWLRPSGKETFGPKACSSLETRVPYSLVR